MASLIPSILERWDEATLRELLWSLFSDTLKVDPASIDPDKSFDEYGLDSIDAVIATELIGKRIGFEIQPEFLFENRSINAVVRALLKDHRVHANETTSAIFLFGGSGGSDEPALARLRGHAAPRVLFELVRVGEWREWVSPDLDLEGIVDRACEFIESRSREGPLLLAGYSQGGQLAYVTALSLQRRGHSVSFVGLLDSETGNLLEPSYRQPFIRSLLGSVLRILSGKKRDEGNENGDGDPRLRILSWLWSLPHGSKLVILIARAGQSVFGARNRIKIDRFIRRRLFAKMWRSWRENNVGSKLHDVRVYLFRSHLNSSDLGWGELCSDLEITPVAGDHCTMLDPSNVELLTAHFADAVCRRVR